MQYLIAPLKTYGSTLVVDDKARWFFAINLDDAFAQARARWPLANGWKCL